MKLQTANGCHARKSQRSEKVLYQMQMSFRRCQGQPYFTELVSRCSTESQRDRFVRDVHSHLEATRVTPRIANDAVLLRPLCQGKAPRLWLRHITDISKTGRVSGHTFFRVEGWFALDLPKHRLKPSNRKPEPASLGPKDRAD